MRDPEEFAKKHAEHAQQRAQASRQDFDKIVQNMHDAVNMQTDQYHKIMQNLVADKDENDMLVGCITVTEMQRPSIIIDEVINNEDDSITPGRKLLTSITFKAPIDPFDYCFPLVYDKLTLVYPPINESWQLMDVIVGLMQPANVDEKTFVATYRGAVRCK